MTGAVTAARGENRGAARTEIVLNANCTRRAAIQIDWDLVSVADFEQLCTVHKYVGFSK